MRKDSASFPGRKVHRGFLRNKKVTKHKTNYFDFIRSFSKSEIERRERVMCYVDFPPLVSKLAVLPAIPVIIIIICDLVSGPRKTFHSLTRKVVFLQSRLYDGVP